MPKMNPQDLSSLSLPTATSTDKMERTLYILLLSSCFAMGLLHLSHEIFLICSFCDAEFKSLGRCL